MIQLEKPDIAFVLQYGNKLSTSIFDACMANKVPVVLRLSDFNLLCAKNIFYRDGEICTKCINNKLFSVKHKCVHDSYIQSFVYYLTQKYNELRKFEKQIDAIIAPSNFTINLLNKSKQFNKTNFYHVPTFVDSIFSKQEIIKRYEFILTSINFSNLLRLALWFPIIKAIKELFGNSIVISSLC